MRVIKYFIISFFILFGSTHLSSQIIEKITINHYEYMNETFKYGEMDSIFVKSSEANAHFLRAKKQFKTSKSLGYISLASLGVGVTGIVIAGNSVGFLSNDPALGAGLAMMVIGGLFGAIMGTSGLIALSSAKKNQRRSVSIFNQEQSDLIPEKRNVELNVIAKNGIGIQMKF